MADDLEKIVEKDIPNIPKMPVRRPFSIEEFYGWFMAISGTTCFVTYSYGYDPKLADGNPVYVAVPAVALAAAAVGAIMVDKYSKK